MPITPHERWILRVNSICFNMLLAWQFDFSVSDCSEGCGRVSRKVPCGNVELQPMSVVHLLGSLEFCTPFAVWFLLSEIFPWLSRSFRKRARTHHGWAGDLREKYLKHLAPHCSGRVFHWLFAWGEAPLGCSPDFSKLKSRKLTTLPCSQNGCCQSRDSAEDDVRAVLSYVMATSIEAMSF